MLTFLIWIILLLLITYYSHFIVGWIASSGIILFYMAQCGCLGFWFWSLALVTLGMVVLLFFAPLRKILITPHIFKLLKGMLPTIGETEKIALEAGTVWWDRELFSGAPAFKSMLKFSEKPLSDEERAFLDGPVEELCEMIHDWNIMQSWNMPQEAWDFIKKHKFFGIIIPKEFGGLGFSARAHSEVVAKLASRSTTAAVTVMVPNSLGPAELLLHYGTEEQKNHYLPRLATGEEIPCFGLTEPTAGSDAGGMKSSGVIEKGTFNGKEVLGIRLNWEKRWITLSPIATVLGLAFVLKDPDGLLGDQKTIGITCALIPTDLEGVQVGKRHNPLHSSFHNGPTWGEDVFIPIDFIIGGEKMAGQGWRMLMESLAAGRSISLPAMSTGNSKLALRTVYTYGHIREQFNLPIIKFEGVEEKVAQIIGWTYIIDAARTLTAGAVDAGEHPSVISAIMKAYTTELGRNVINNAMDVRAGSEITLGPKNILGNVYTSMPISITVEGANILTRTLIIYGQGAIRCHPFIQDEIRAIETEDLDLFDKSFFGHVWFTARNKARAFLLGLTNGYIASVPGDRETRRALQQLMRFSAGFAFMSDVCMGLLGGSLKRKEKLSGRLADVLSWLYLTTAVVKRYLDGDRDKKEAYIMKWASTYGLYQIQEALMGVLQNLEKGPLGWMLQSILFPFGRVIQPPTDKLGHKVVQALELDVLFNRMTEGLYIPDESEEGLGFLEKTFEAIIQTQSIDSKLKNAIKEGKISRGRNGLQQALDASVITEAEFKQVQEREKLKRSAIEVDHFDFDAFDRTSQDQDVTEDTNDDT